MPTDKEFSLHWYTSPVASTGALHFKNRDLAARDIFHHEHFSGVPLLFFFFNYFSECGSKDAFFP